MRVIASQRGGMDIEEIAANEPEALIQVVVEPAVGLQQFQAREIAFQLGFSESSAFHRSFKRRTGLTPREFRRRASIP